MTNNDQIRFQIDQLRKDKIIYATESIAITLISFLVLLFLAFFYDKFTTPMRTIIFAASTLIPIGYGLFMGIGNFRRLQKIKQLEIELFK